ncbi:MAG: type II toxin-antitoxin system Phd/YefM family antitoxin [Saccharofermentans sp.]|nr:type II toxin-antitoxin system Phd/YefM family antitoxin [Saccharofermentans sp.]
MNQQSIADKIVSVSEFSQGKTGRIFRDIKDNKCDYLVMKNNNPIAVIIPFDEYISYKERMKAIVSNNRIGVAKGLFDVPDDFDEWDIGFGEESDEDLT